MKIWLIKLGEKTGDGTAMMHKRFSGETIFEAIEKAKAWLEREELNEQVLKEKFDNFKKDFPDDDKSFEEFAEEQRTEYYAITSVILEDNLDDVD